MTASPQTLRDQADREAIDWLILLQDDPDDASAQADFEKWLQACPLHIVAWNETRRAADVLGAAEPTYSSYWANLVDRAPSVSGLDVAAEALGKSANIAPPMHRPRRWVSVAGFAMAACLALAVAPQLLMQIRADEMTETAEVRSVKLVDGSSVRLGPDSAIALAFTDTERRVRLLRGDAYFEVRHDPAHPFRVEAGNVRTTVLGTGFEVRRRDDGADVAVRHGRVRVDDSHGTRQVSAILSVGDHIALRGGGIVERDRIRPDKIAAWTERMLIVNDRPVREAVDALRPWYSGVIISTGRNLASERITGVYNLGDPVAALAAISEAHGASVYRLSPWVTIIYSY